MRPLALVLFILVGAIQYGACGYPRALRATPRLILAGIQVWALVYLWSHGPCMN